MPVTLIEASFTSVIFPVALMVTNGSKLASIKLRAYLDDCFWAASSGVASSLPDGAGLMG